MIVYTLQETDCTVYCFFIISGVYNESTNEIITGGVGNVTVSIALGGYRPFYSRLLSSLTLEW